MTEEKLKSIIDMPKQSCELIDIQYIIACNTADMALQLTTIAEYLKYLHDRDIENDKDKKLWDERMREQTGKAQKSKLKQKQP